MDLHPIKTEIFDIPARTNTDPKGLLRQVDTYTTTEFGLYMARGANHPRFGYLESWLLPSVHLRVNKFHNRPEFPTTETYYIDIAHIRQANPQDAGLDAGLDSGAPGTHWYTQDLYIDLRHTPGEPVRFEDVDELAAAAATGLLPPQLADAAITAALEAVAGITRHDDDLLRWLASLGMPLTWAEQVELVPAQ